MEKILTKGLQFVDERGRVRFFNGMNIDDKLLGCERFRSPLDEAFFQKYTARGFNFIRLAVTWANLEPHLEEYNESYLQSIDGIFTLAEKYGVYILLDMHQDLYSGYGGVGGGDGAPSWATLTDGHVPQPAKFVWGEAYVFGKWVHSAYDHFWHNDPVWGRGLQDRFADLWKMMAARYGDRPALFGFDLLNEPFPGSFGTKLVAALVRSAAGQIFTSPKIDRKAIAAALLKRDVPALLGAVKGNAIRDIMQGVDGLSAEFDRVYYWPFLNKMAAAIREVTPNGILMMEQTTLCNGGARQSVPPIIVNGEREPLQCYGPHAYDMTVDTPLYRYANADRVKAFFTEQGHAQERLDVPMIVAEWGGCSDNTDVSWFPHAYELLDFFDENQWGQVYWDYHGDDLDAPLMEMLSRTVPVAVAGTVKHFGLDRRNGVFTLAYTAADEGETLVYIHKPAAVLCDGVCETVTEYDGGAKLVKITAPAGEHRVEIRF